MARIPGFGVAALFASSLIGTASGASMYAFYSGTNKGVQVGMQDPKSGDIWVNNCNANIDGAPLFPTESPIVLPVGSKVKMGGSIAATGWWDSQHVIASIFWHAADGTIVNGLYQCNDDSGSFAQTGEYVISNTSNVSPDDIHPNTGLAVELLGSTAGYRVFYHNKDGQVNELSYTTSTNWDYGGSVSQDSTSGFALGSAHSSTDNITVVFPKSSKDIEVSRLNQDNTWHISTFPETIENSPTNKTAASKIEINTDVATKFALPAWNGKPGALGVAIDNSFTRTVYYIGTDKKLYEVGNINFQWSVFANQSASSWPEADDANADLAATYNQQTGEAWVYYSSNGSLVQAYRGTNGKWSAHTVLPTSASTPGGGSTGGGSSNTGSGDNDNNAQTPSAGLSTGAKAGIGIGVSVGAIGVGLLGLFFFLRRRRQQAAANAAANDKDQPINLGEYRSPSEQALYMADGTLAPAYTPQTPYDAHDPVKKAGTPVSAQMNMVSPLVEMEQPPMIYELPQTNYSYELPAESVDHSSVEHR
ncbi:hypothetical protein ACHAQJ_004211 [Trichoderma viride]